MPADVDAQMKQLEARAQEADQAKERAFDSMAPEGKFSAPDLNSLVDSLNTVLEHFGRPPYPAFKEGIDGVLPTDFAKNLAMVSEAAKSAGLERLAWDVSELETDGDLESVQARLDVLAQNQPFITWLKTDTAPAQEPEVAEAPAPAPEVAPPAPPTPTPDADALFASRA